MSPSARIASGFAAFAAVTTGGFLLPRMVAGNDSGLAASTNAAVAFLGCMAIATVIGIVLLILTLRNRARLTTASRLLGLAPLPLLVATVVVVFAIAIARQQDRREADAPAHTPPATTTASAP